MGRIMEVPCVICGRTQPLEVENVLETLQKNSNKPVDIKEYDLVCHKCSQTYQYRQKYVGTKWKKHFILGPKPPVFK